MTLVPLFVVSVSVLQTEMAEDDILEKILKDLSILDLQGRDHSVQIKFMTEKFYVALDVEDDEREKRREVYIVYTL